MWPFSKKTLISSAAFANLVDYHSHILPGVDDGVQTVEESLAILKRFEELGVVRVWCTPHIMEDIPNSTAFLKERFAELTSAYDGPIQLSLSAENMLDSLFDERLEKNDVLPLGDEGNQLLVETSYFCPPTGLDRIFAKIKSNGYFPVLAHPERYCYMTNSDYQKWNEEGIRFQLNLFSLTGTYGAVARDKAEWLLSRNMYSYRGSDIHSINLLECANKKIRKI